MDNLKLCQYSDSSDEEQSSNVDFFGLQNSTKDNLSIQVCDHDVVIINNDNKCWKCQMAAYQEANMKDNNKMYGPAKRPFIHNCFQVNKWPRKLQETSAVKNVADVKQEETGHSKCVNEVQWHPIESYADQLLSCSMDGTIRIWDSKCNRETFKKAVSKTAVRSAKWSHDGKRIFTADFDFNLKLLDMETGRESMCIPHDDYVTSLCLHPCNHNLVLSGSKRLVSCWDIRAKTNKATKTFAGNFGQVRDITFLSNQLEFICCTDTVERESADRAIMAWDFDSGVLISNQIYQERYSCVALKTHPYDETFLAQSNGNYVAIFSAHQPFKINRRKRFDKHKVCGYGITFDLDSSGKTLVTGSANGILYYYDYYTGKNYRTRTVFSTDDPCIAVKINPLTSVVAVGSWSGKLLFLK